MSGDNSLQDTWLAWFLLRTLSFFSRHRCVPRCRATLLFRQKLAPLANDGKGLNSTNVRLFLLPVPSPTLVYDTEHHRRQRSTSADRGAFTRAGSLRQRWATAAPVPGTRRAATLTPTAPSKPRSMPLPPSRCAIPSGASCAPRSVTAEVEARAGTPLQARRSSTLADDDATGGDEREATGDDYVSSPPQARETGGVGGEVGDGVAGGSRRYAEGPFTRMNLVTAVNAGLRTAMETDPTAVRICVSTA